MLSKDYICGTSIAAIAGSNLAEYMDVCLVSLLCREQPLRWADLSFRGVLPGLCVGLTLKGPN